jgi:hypothetical protein
MTLKFSLEGDDIGKAFKQSLEQQYNVVADASRDAITEARNVIKRDGDADISRAGNFGPRWQKSLNVNVVPARGRTVNLLINVFHTIAYWRVHEHGATIKGRPLLWIPLPWTGLKIRAREYGRRYGLFRVEREGKNPLLFSMADKKPKYVGVEQVRLKKRFHLSQIVRATAQQLPKFYAAAYRRRARGRR